MNGMKLAEPSMKYDAQIQAYRKEFLEYGGSMDGTNSLRQYEKTQDWLDHLEIRRTPELLPPGRTLSRQYLYIREEDEKIVLFYTGTMKKAELLTELRQRLPRYMIPNVLFLIEQLPLTPNGKMNRKAMEQFYMDHKKSKRRREK